MTSNNQEMDEVQKKEQWKTEVMDSLQGIRRAEPNPFLFTRIEAAIAKRIDTVTPRQWRLAIAFTVLILALNGWFLRNNNPQRVNNNAEFNNRYQMY